MKVIQVTDTHLGAPGEMVHDLDPGTRLAACIADINAHHADAAMCIITGDLAHGGKREAYIELRRVLADLTIPYHLIIGNHDRREVFREVFPETPVDEHGFVQRAIDCAAGRFILLDTVVEKEKWGAFCDKRSAWLERRVAEAEGRPVYLFMHHPPFKTGIPSLDRIRLLDPAILRQVVRRHPNIKHIFFGHTHRPMAGHWAGIPFSILRGTNHQVALDFNAEAKIPRSHEPPAYAVILFGADDLVIHFHDYLDQTAYFLAS
jgi:3',5'-cyclic AMP phosphodiesterase CpdA